MTRWNLLRQVGLYLLLLVLLLRQWQMQTEIRRLQEDFLVHQRAVVEFMETTNKSVENLAKASASNSNAILMLSKWLGQ